ncbi:MAG: response regulator [Butyrivibrio sp.]|nr:response regulator [Butyrivibrio sp.]
MNRNSGKLRVVIRLVSVMIWIALTTLCIFTVLHGDKFMLSSGETVYATFYLVPFLLIGGLYGYYVSMISFVVAFGFSLFFSASTSYNMVIYLVATLLYALFAQYKYFKSIKKTFIAMIVTLIGTGFAEYACFSVIMINKYDLTNLNAFLQYIGRDIWSVILTSIVVCLILNKLPDIIKMIFPIGVGYTKAFEENIEIQRTIRKTKVSIKITAIIIGLELILGIAVAFYMVVLFPDLRDMFVEGFDRVGNAPIAEQYKAPNENNAGSADSAVSATNESSAGSNDNTASDSEEEEAISRIRQIEFRLDDAMLSYDIKMILLMLCVGVPFAALANFYTKTTIGGPIGYMSDFMYDYANSDDDKRIEVGKKVDRIKVGTRDEIKVLHESLKTTVHSVEDYIARIKAKQELEKELEVAQKASEAKSSFLSNMSHEIRTPINAVLGMNEMILREADNDQILEYANNVKSAGNSLLGIINDILDFSKIEAGKMDILPVEYHLGSTINDLINMVSVKAEDKGLELKLNIDKTLPSVLIGDEIRIKQCVTNILSNAVKYTEEGSVTLNVSYKKEEGNNILLRFQVVDTGIGIKEEDLNKLYSPFERIEEIRNRSIEGTGLGMSIVKKLLALMDSRLEVKSVYGEGSDFSFEVKQEVVSFEELGDFKQKYKEYLKSREKYRERFRAPNAEILVVDDTPMNLTVVKGLLKNTQIKVDTAESGEETLQKVSQKRYDVIFIDHRMPGMDGIETLAAMKELKGNLCEGAACIALTANAGASAREEYLAAGFDDYLSKPVDGLVLENMLREYLPDEKILTVEDSKESVSADEGTEDDERKALFKKIEGIDFDEALKNCGSMDVLENVAHEFYVSIDPKADDIERFLTEKDYRNYTVAVHALKSSARLIGATKLSQDAAYLEKCGNEGNEDKIQSKTPKLLELYRSYKEKLFEVLGEKENADLPEISEEELKGAFSDMKELLEAYDFDTADGIMKMLSEYSIPDGYKDKYKKIVELMAAVDRDALIELLKDFVS